MKLINMKRSKTEAKKRSTEDKAIAVSSEEYPWGLRLNLETESLSKLGIDIKKMKLNAVMDLQAKVKITSLNDNQQADGPDNRSMDLQITQMALSGTKGPSKAKQFFDLKKAGPG